MIHGMLDPTKAYLFSTLEDFMWFHFIGIIKWIVLLVILKIRLKEGNFEKIKLVLGFGKYNTALRKFKNECLKCGYLEQEIRCRKLI